MKTKLQRQEERAKWDHEEAERIEALKISLALKHSLKRDAKFDAAWRLAWDYGHASGFDEISYYFDDLAALIK